MNLKRKNNVFAENNMSKMLAIEVMIKIFPDNHNRPTAKENRRIMLLWRTNNFGCPHIFPNV
jgi:hypothetical protein